MGIVGSGDDRWKVEEELKQGKVLAFKEPSMIHPLGCPYGQLWCRKERAYLWVTRFYIEFVTF